MTSAKGGRPYKSAKIADGFNPTKSGITKKDMAQAKRIALAEKKYAAKAKPPSPRKKPAKVTAPAPVDSGFVITGLDAEGWPVWGLPLGAEGTSEPTRPPAPPKVKDDSEDDEVSAQKMLADMRWVYKTLDGREKLKAMMAGDKEFMAMVKELMKAEISILTNKAKAGGSGRQGFFVILKGLEEEKPIVQALEQNQVIDIRQIERAINPAEYQMEEDEGEQVRGAGPAEIVKKAEGIESIENW
jgi:hypothetical protein